MGEEVTQYELVNSHTDNSNSNDSTGEQDVKGDSIDEVDKTIVASSPPASLSSEDECGNIKFIEECEKIKTNCDEDNEEKSNSNDQNDSVLQQKQQMDKSARKISHVNGHKPHEVSIEKSKKWYNISFINRGNNINNGNAINAAAAVARNSRSNNSCEKKNSDKMDKRHSWHLNDSAVVEM